MLDTDWGNTPTIFSDLHLDFYTNYSEPIKGTNSNDRTEHQFDILKQIINIANSRHSPLVFAGDFFNERGQVDVRVYNRAVDILVHNLAVPMIMVAGNHDQIDNTPVPETSIDSLQYLVFENKNASISVYKEVQTVTLGNIEYTLLPYSEDVPTFKEDLHAVTDTTLTEKGHRGLLIAHIGVDGATSGKYNHRLGGAYGLGDLEPDKFDQIFIGHYHDRQALAGNVCYVGSTIPNSFNDEGLEKGIYLYDGNTNEKEFMPLKSKLFLTLNLEDLPKNIKSDEDLTALLRTNYYKVVSSSQEKVKELQQKSNEEDLYVNFEVKAETTITSRLGIDPQAGAKEIVEAYTDKFHPAVTKQALNVLEQV